MPNNGSFRGLAVHATAVAIEGHAFLIVGPSRSGKSELAASLLAISTLQRCIELVGDDRVVILVGSDHKPVVQPHPRIAGFMERRGLGIVAIAHRAVAPLSGIVLLGNATTGRLAPLNLPVLTLSDVNGRNKRRDLVCTWSAVLAVAASGTHSIERKPLTAA